MRAGTGGGRTAPGEDAIALIEVDQKLTANLIETVRRNWAAFAHNGIAGLDSPSLHFG